MIPVLLSFDVEPDGYFLNRDRPASWRGFELSIPFARALRERLSRITGRPVRFNWLLRMDPQIRDTYGSADWVAGTYAEAIAELASAGDEIGLHVHGYRWAHDLQGWIVDHGNQAHIDYAVAMAVEAFRGAFGRPAQAFRFGDRWTNEATLRLAASLGVQYEMTVEPGHVAVPTYHPGEPFTGHLPDTRRVLRVPYQPSEFDFCVPAASRPDGLWIIPVTTAPVQPRLHRRAYYRLFKPQRLAHAWNALLSHEPTLFRRIIDWTFRQPGPSHLSLVLRTQALAGPPIVRRIERNLDMLLARPDATTFSWTTPDAVVSAAAADRARAVATA